MNLTDRITENFNNGYFDKAMSIEEMPVDYPAWTINTRTWYGVIVPTENEEVFNESFSSAKIYTHPNVEINGVKYNVLMLVSENIELKSEFATICSQFVDPGKDGENRNELTSDPQKWWNHWRTLMGNAVSKDEAYPVLGELITLEYYLKKHYAPVWRGPERSSHDIEFSNFSCEVKSTTQRYKKEITISGIHQLKQYGKKLELVFCRFERSLLGKSINEEIEILVSLGYDRAELENKLSKQDLNEGCVARKLRYKLLEMNKYIVDDAFPKITEKSFKNDVLPKSITEIQYTVDLSGIECENLL